MEEARPVNSISRQILSSLFFTLVGVMGVWAYLEYEGSRRRGEADLRQDLQAMTDHAAFTLSSPLWNLNRAEVAMNIQYDMAQPMVKAILLHDESGKLILGKIRDQREIQHDFDPSRPEHLAWLAESGGASQAQVQKNGKVIGKVEIFANKAPLAERLKKSRRELVLKLLVLLASLLAVTFLALKGVVQRPLARLSQWVAQLEPGQDSIPLQVGPSTELNALSQTISGMSQRIAKVSRELRASEEWHRVLFEKSQYALMTLSPPSWRFDSGNEATVKMFRTRDLPEFLSKEPWQLSPPIQPDGKPSEEKAREMIEKAMQEGSNLFEWTHRRADGQDFPATVLLTRMEIKGQVLLHATVRDDSEKAVLQADLAKGQEKFEVLYHAMPYPVFVYDLKSRRLVEANPALADLVKMPIQDLIGMNVIQFIPPADREAFSNVLATMDPLAVRNYRHQIMDSERNLVDVEVNSHPVKIEGQALRMAMLRDLRPEMKAQESIRQSEQLHRALVENTQDPVVIYRKDGRVFQENPQALTAMLGYSLEELKAFGPFDLIHPDDIKAALQNLELVQREPGARSQIELRVKAKDGAYKTCEVRGVNLMQIPVVSGILFQIRDVSASREAQKTLMRFERLAAIGQTAAGLAHEVRNPLATITATAEYLKGQFNDKPALAGELDSILRQVERLRDLVHEVLERSRTEDLKLAQGSAKDLLEAALKSAQLRFGQAAGRVDLRRDYRDPPFTVRADLAQMERVLQNLILNAYQAAPAGGALTLGLSQEGGEACFSVADNGPGILEGRLPRIFDPFFTTKETGSGLGLWICKSIVEQHGGRLEVENLPPQGCRFTVRLPGNGAKA